MLLIRHGETQWNREGRIQGYHADSPLTDAGEAQARLLAQRLAGEGLAAVHCSDAGRARQTAAPIAAALRLEIVYDAALRERSYGEFEGWTYEELERERPDAYRRFRSRDPDYAPPGGESGAQFSQRIVSALGRIAAAAAAASGARAAVVTHGGVLGVMYRHINGTSPQAARDYSLLNASINRLLFSGGRWSIESWGDVAHLGAGSGDGIQGA